MLNNHRLVGSNPRLRLKSASAILPAILPAILFAFGSSTPACRCNVDQQACIVPVLQGLSRIANFRNGFASLANCGQN